VIRPAKILAAAGFALSVVAGTVLDSPSVTGPSSDTILAADFHVHPYPGDGSLPLWELRHEARRRGLDVIAITGHNNRFGLDVGRLMPPDIDAPIVIAGQEVTTEVFHLIALGTDTLVDWRLSAREAIDAIHAQGGAAIAAHPVPGSWRDRDAAALHALDGAEVAHQSITRFSRSRDLFEQFFAWAQSVNPGIAPIGSSDFHMTAPLGLCRTYVFAGERSAKAVIEAVRGGRTVARDARGQLYGRPEDVARVRQLLETAPDPSVGMAERAAALGALFALAALVVLR
jgi:hypothetical protein